MVGCISRMAKTLSNSFLLLPDLRSWVRFPVVVVFYVVNRVTLTDDDIDCVYHLISK